MKEVFVRLDRCLGCKSCEIACAVEHSAAKSLFSAVSEKPGPVRRVYVEMAEVCVRGCLGAVLRKAHPGLSVDSGSQFPSEGSTGNRIPF